MLLALTSLRWSVGVGFLLFWNAMFFALDRLERACPPDDKQCSPLHEPILCGTLILTALFFLSMVWSETVRRIVIAPKRRAFFDEHTFYAFALISLAIAAYYLFFE